MADKTINKVVIMGAGLAGNMCALALARTLPEPIEIILVETSNSAKKDVFFGNVTSPTSYDFLLKLGLSEPELLLDTDTTFSLGTQYINWGAATPSWTQSFHIPLPIFEGVEFHHYVIRQYQTQLTPPTLEPYIMSVQAANKGVFAHPPEEKTTPLASVEYGYHVSPEKWAEFFAKALTKTRVQRLNKDIKSTVHSDGYIKSLLLDDSESLEADFFIDCSGLPMGPSSDQENAWIGQRVLKAESSHTTQTEIQSVKRTLTAEEYGWRSETPLLGSVHHLKISEPQLDTKDLETSEEVKEKSEVATLGRRKEAWIGNYLIIGHGAAILEPLTPAPMMLLQRDIERLTELLPISKKMSVESREYNRRFDDDYTHAEMFQRTFFEAKELPNTAYWKTARSDTISDKLSAKITQFKSRGVFAQYDYEPFNQQDWAMLYFGLGFIPSRYDPLVDRISVERIEKTLIQMRTSIMHMAGKMPPHQTYMSGLLKYLEEKYG